MKTGLKFPLLEYVGDVYRPSDDTWLLVKVLEEENPRGDLCLDLGAGSGVLGIYAILNNICKRVIFIDVMEDAVESTRVNVNINGVQQYSVIVLLNDTALRENSVDIVLANPPYLPIHDRSKVDIATEGGPEGYETIVYFVNFANKVLKPGGKLYLAYSSFSRPEVVWKYLESSGLKVNYVKNKRFFYEIIYVVECVKPW